MQTIKPHSHQDREQVIQKLIPVLQKKFGENMVALAADGSYARHEDADYSDLELILFLNTVPDSGWSLRKIINGLLIVVVANTKDSFIKKYLEANNIWYASGAGRLLPIVNPKFITEINAFQPTNLEIKRWEIATDKWKDYQEITAKLLNIISQRKTDAIPLVFHEMLKVLLSILSYINATPYKTLNSYISQAREFSIKPATFIGLLNIYLDGSYKDLDVLRTITTSVFEEMEEIFAKENIKLDSNLSDL